MDGYTLITGATGGLGEEFCRQTLERGDRLVLTGRSAEKLEKLKTGLLSLKPSAEIVTIPCMLDSAEERKRFFEKTDALGIKFSRLIEVAGVDTQLAFEKYTEEKLLFQTRVNLEATVSVARYVLERRTEELSILVVGSMSGTCPMPYFALYSATKAAVMYFFSSLRAEMKGKGVKVTVVMPGAVPTRPDIVEDIKRQGLKGRLSQKSKDFVVKKALKGAEKNKRVVIPGFFNKLTYAVTKITPVALQTAFVAKNWSGKEKDAFK